VDAGQSNLQRVQRARTSLATAHSTGHSARGTTLDSNAVILLVESHDMAPEACRMCEVGETMLGLAVVNKADSISQPKLPAMLSAKNKRRSTNSTRPVKLHHDGSHCRVLNQVSRSR
jgi:hypothetical protein